MTMYIELTHGERATVDDCFYGELNAYKWMVKKRGNTLYAVREAPSVNGKKGKTISMHCQVLEMAGIPLGVTTDHRDMNGLNNQLSNLRPATYAENQQNTGLDSRNKSGYKGVHFDRTLGKWKVQIAANGVRKYLGLYPTAAAAAAAYDEAAIAFHGEFAHTNGMIGLAQSDGRIPTSRLAD